MPKLLETREWGSATFIGTRNTYSGVTMQPHEIEDLALVHSFIAEIHQDHEGNTVVVLLANNPDDTIKGVNELTRKLS